MDKKSIILDLKLWQNQAYWQKQNQLKIDFWSIMGDLSNSISLESLIRIHPSCKGKKLSCGNELNGFPYQVLDLIRDFDLNKGLNIRLLNWFGVGFYIFVLIGKENIYAPDTHWIHNDYCLGLTDSPWSYQELVSQQMYTANPTLAEMKNLKFYHWFKQIELTGNIIDIEKNILGHLTKTLNSFVLS